MWPFTKKPSPAAVPRASTEAVAFQLKPKPVQKHQTPADVLDYWCHKFGATYERQPRQDGSVRVRVLLPNGDVVSGNAATTALAVAEVSKKLEAL